jgi:hypothetical protein
MDSRDEEKQEMELNGGRRDDGVAPLPTDALEAVVQDIEDAGGAYEEAPSTRARSAGPCSTPRTARTARSPL